MNRQVTLGALMLLLAIPVTVAAQSYTFQTLNFKTARGIDDGLFGGVEISGDSGTLYNGVYSNVVVPYSDPGSTVVNRNNNYGDLVGHYTLNGVQHGFYYSPSRNQILQFVDVDFPQYGGEPLGIDDNGVIVGYYVDGAGQTHGYVKDKAGFHTVDCPFAPGTILYQSFTGAGSPDSAGAVGECSDQQAGLHGFYYRYHDQNVLYVDIPGAIATTARGIGGFGVIVGQYVDPQLKGHGFATTSALGAPVTYRTIDVPGVDTTMVMQINSSGSVVGYYEAKDGKVGFLGVPVPTGVLPTAGGVVGTEPIGLGAAFEIEAPAGVFSTRTNVTLGLLPDPLQLPIPPNYSRPGTYAGQILLSPEPLFPLPGAGVTLVIPTTGDVAPGDRLDLFRVDPASRQLVAEPDPSGNPASGIVDARGLTATFHNVSQLSTVVGLAPATIRVGIEIKPGENPASIQPKSNGKIPVAILSSAAFPAPVVVDQTTLTFGHTGDEHSLAFCSGLADVNGDGLPDLVCHFDTQAAAFQRGDTQGILKGKTVANVRIEGSGAVRIVP